MQQVKDVIVTFSTLTDEELLATNGVLLDQLRQLFAALRTEVYDKTVLRPIRNLASMVSSLPASMAHHDNDEGGLFRHTLEVAIASVQYFDIETNYRQIEDKSARQEIERSRLASFGTALLHDLGKLNQMRVSSSPKVKEGVVWPPGRKPLCQWLAAHNLSSYYIAWYTGRSRRDWRDHEPLGTLYYNKIFSADWINKVGRKNVNQVIHSLGKNLHTANAQRRNAISRSLEVADRRITAISWQRAREKQHEEAVEQVNNDADSSGSQSSLQPLMQINPGSRIAHDFIWGLRELRKAGKLTINVTGADTFIGSTHTILLLDEPSKGVEPLPLRVGKVLGIHFTSSENNNKMLVARYASLIDAPAAISFFGAELHGCWGKSALPLNAGVLPEIGQISSSGIQHVIVYRTTPDSPAMERHAWIVHNKIAWGVDAPTPQPDCFSGEIDIRQGDGRTPSFPPDEIGFIPLAGIDRDDAFGKQDALPTEVDEQGEPKRRILTSEGLKLETLSPQAEGTSLFPSPAESVYRLWQLLNQFVPIPEADDPIHHSWHYLDAQINSRNGVDEDQVDQVLHHIIGRLRPNAVSWDQVGTLAQTMVEAAPTRKTAYPDKRGRSDRARYLQTIDDDHIPSARELADRLLGVALAAQDTQAGKASKRDWAMAVDGPFVGIRWPMGFASLCGEDENQSRLITAAADVLLLDIYAHLRDVVKPGTSGLALSFAQVKGSRYKSAANHDCLLVIDTSMIEVSQVPLVIASSVIEGVVLHASWTLIT